MEEQTAEQRLGFQEVMAAIATCQTALTNKIEAVQLDVSLIRQDFDKLRTRVSEAEQRVGLAEDTVREHTASIRTLQTRSERWNINSTTWKIGTGGTISRSLACQKVRRGKIPRYL